jgi:hypothetical protein
VGIPELDRLKGLNILKVDLVRVEAKLRSKYPQLSGLHVMRRFPDQIAVSAFKRIPFAQVSLGGRVLVVDPQGFMIGPPKGEEGPLTLIKGLKQQQVVIGDAIEDENFAVAVRVLGVFARDSVLSKVPLRSVDVEDKARVVCALGEDGAMFEVFVDQATFAGKSAELATLLSHHEVDLTQVKYIDVRFGEPTIAQKKVSRQ